MSSQTQSELPTIIAYLDLLGFKHRILEQPQEDIDTIYSLIFKQLEKPEPSIETLVVSDSVILKAISSPLNLRHILELVRAFQCELLLNGILVRGAITAGNVIYKNDGGGRIRLYGKAYQEAYLLEQKIAQVPRVILDPQLVSVAQVANRNELSKTMNGFVLSELRRSLGPLAQVDNTLLYWMPPTSGYDDLPFVAYGQLLLRKVFDWDSQAHQWKPTVPKFLELLKQLTYESCEEWAKMQWVRAYLSEAFEDFIHFWSHAYPSDGEGMVYAGLREALKSI